MVKFGYTICYVPDVEKAISFFENAFEMKRKFVSEENDYGELSTGEVTLSFASHELGRTNFSGSYVNAAESNHPLGIELALVTEDVQSVHDCAIALGARELKSPEPKPWGQIVSYLRCPSGLLIELCTPVGE